MKSLPWPELAAAACLALSRFVELHIWSPAATYFLVMLMVTVDVLTDLMLHQRPWRPRVLLFILPAYTIIMALAHNFGKNEASLSWLPQGVILLIVVIHLRRLVRNFSNLRWVDGEVATVLDANLSKRMVKVSEELETQPAITETTKQPAPDEAVPA